jgi:hypothetical protein
MRRRRSLEWIVYEYPIIQELTAFGRKHGLNIKSEERVVFDGADREHDAIVSRSPYTGPLKRFVHLL